MSSPLDTVTSLEARPPDGTTSERRCKSTSVRALQAQQARGFGWLRFDKALETPFRRDLFCSGHRTRLGLMFIVLALHLATPLYYQPLLQVPEAFVGHAYAWQYGLQLPAVVAGCLAVWFRLRWWMMQTLCIVAFMAVVIGVLGQRTMGASYGFEVPSEFVAIATAGLLVAARLPLWSTLPWALLSTIAMLANEWLFVPADPAATYHMLTSLILTGMALFCGYTVEYGIRESWLTNRLLGCLSREDGLTGLLNRSALETAVEQGVQHCRRAHCAFAVAMIDIDYFKAYNDTYGHRAGDRVIRRVADILQAGARRPQDVCGRYGGEEFTLLWIDGDYADLYALAENIRRDIEAANITHRVSRVSDRITVSIGLYCADTAQAAAWAKTADNAPGTVATQLLASADTLLYRAKSGGRDRVVSARAGGVGEPADVEARNGDAMDVVERVERFS